MKIDLSATSGMPNSMPTTCIDGASPSVRNQTEVVQNSRLCHSVTFRVSR